MAALALLLLNDFVLKPRLGNALTGKLSDFAGLYLFTAFWVALLPGHRRRVILGVATAWVAWKTPLSTPAIELWNALGPWRVARVMDPTDLSALAVLPLVRMDSVRWPQWGRLAGPAMACLCVFSFAATTLPPPPIIDLPTADYELPIGREEVLRRIYALRLDYADPGVPPGGDSPLVTLRLPPERAEPQAPPEQQPEVVFEVLHAGSGSVIRLLRAQVPGRLAPRDTLRAWFERRVVERIRRNQPNPAPRPPRVSGADPYFRPRLVAPASLAEPRHRVQVSLARPAHVSLIEVGVDGEWRAIYPVEGASPVLPAGVSVLETSCSASAPATSSPCAVAAPAAPGSTGRMLMLATDAALTRAGLDSALADPAFPRAELWSLPLQRALGRLARAAGGGRAAASETVLRR